MTAVLYIGIFAGLALINYLTDGWFPLLIGIGVILYAFSTLDKF